MTFESGDKNGDGEDPPGKPSYAVGYGRPPAKRRFKKGQSGNPLGRPRKTQLAQTEPLDFGTQPANHHLLEEAYRLVTVREGERTIQMPAIQAVFRAMMVDALKGNRVAQRTIAGLVQRVETEDQKLLTEYWQKMSEYKYFWDAEIEEARKLGCPEPQPIPHPDDIILDAANRLPMVCGPTTKEEKAGWNRMLEFRDELQEEVSMFAGWHRKSRSAKKKAFALDQWKSTQKVYDKLNDNLPNRYRKDLVDRCWLDGASRAGDQRTRNWPGDRP